MPRLFRVIKDVFSIEELRIRILNTVVFLLLFRLGSYVVLPGINPAKLTGEARGIFGLLDAFLGGAFSNASVLGLGVMPYISASIAIQLLTIAFPYFQRLQKEGHSGRKILNQMTKVLTIFIAIVQAVAYLSAAVSEEVIVISRSFFTGVSIFILTAGTMFCVWLGDRITDKGIGNGVSMLIMIGIISSLPGALFSEVLSRGTRGSLVLFVEFLVLFMVVAGVVMFTQATRRIPVQYAKQMVSSSSTYTYGGHRQYIPLKLNTSGVMPIIFSQALMFLPALVASIWSEKSSVATFVGRVFSDYTTWQYNVTFSLLIVIFTFFYTAITINPNQIADDMKRNSGFIPGVKPGKPTSEFIDNILSKITLPGSLFLAAIAILPAFAHMAGVNSSFSRFYGGTSLLIMVGVVLDTLQQVESLLLMRRYKGLMKSGRTQK
ncbi:MAG: preprotein translocase subunit SecY [Amoebophilaceae bacterium]|nr:preprotein translocase subunit SecY [Amoebophilaceae bacterium]